MKYIRNYTDLQHFLNSIIPIIPYIELTLIQIHAPYRIPIESELKKKEVILTILDILYSTKRSLYYTPKMIASQKLQNRLFI